MNRKSAIFLQEVSIMLINPFRPFLPVCCLSFLDLRILITPLVSSNSSYGVYGALKHTNAYFSYILSVRVLSVRNYQIA
jgi:hypothetical protein